MAYRIFVTDALRSIAKNTAGLANGGEYPSKRYVDVIQMLEAEPETRTPQEIIENTKDSLRRLGNGNAT